MFKQNTMPVHTVFITAITVAVVMVIYRSSSCIGLAVPLATAVGFIAAMSYAYRGFGGISGDLAGFALTIGELSGLIALALV